MKKITCYIASLTCGGAEHQMVELVRLLQCRGYNVTLATRENNPDHYILPNNVERIRIKQGKSVIAKFYYHFMYFIKVDTDVIISFQQRASMYMLPALFFRKKIKVIASERNLTYGKPSKIEKLLMSFLYKRANYIVPNSYSQRTHLLKIRPEWINKIITITNYTDINHYFYSELPHNSIIRIGVFCRYAKQKNYERFVEVIHNIVKKGFTSFIVEWYGKQMNCNGFNPDYLLMKELVDKMNLGEYLVLNDKIDDVACLMSEFDAICLPSLYEGFSNTLSEAICCGRPILAGNVSDNPVMVKEGLNGFLFDPEKVDDMQKAFIQFLKLPYEKRQEMGMNSRKIAESLFDSNRFIENYITLIEN